MNRKTVVLVVDDNADVLKCLEVVLRHYGFAVHAAGNGHVAAQLYRQHRNTIDVVLLDVQMPGVDGLDTLVLLKDINPAVRVVFMTGNIGLYSYKELLAVGAVTVLEKPFQSIPELAKTLWQLASRGEGLPPPGLSCFPAQIPLENA